MHACCVAHAGVLQGHLYSERGWNLACLTELDVCPLFTPCPQGHVYSERDWNLAFPRETKDAYFA